MSWSRAAAAFLIFTGGLCTSSAALAQGASGTPPGWQSSGLRNPHIEIAYVEPTSAALRPIYDRLRKRMVLEQLQAFLAPLRLPKTLSIKADQCGALSVPYDASGPVRLCYEYVEQMERLAPESFVYIGSGYLTRDDALVGAFVQLALHETTLATFSMLDIPFWGREDFAADNVAGFIMLQFGKDVAWRTLVGTAWLLAQSGALGIGRDFHAVRSPEGQRFFNYLCLAYAADPKRFEFLVTNSDLPQGRAEYCKQDYDKLRKSFAQVIMPHVDPELLKRVQAVTWLPSSE
ncbi:MAG TPA: DUF4344 domain-containing metallopeptidase [Xanthobacteraceae bacterium]|jgi:hypothetical protein